MQGDLFSSAINRQRDRISGTENAFAASKVVDEIKTQFPTSTFLSDPLVKTSLSFAPLLFLQPYQKGNDLGSVIQDPRVWGIGLAVGAAILSHLTKQEPAELTITPSSANLRVSQIFGRKISWISLDPAATVDPKRA